MSAAEDNKLRIGDSFIIENANDDLSLVLAVMFNDLIKRNLQLMILIDNADGELTPISDSL